VSIEGNPPLLKKGGSYSVSVGEIITIKFRAVMTVCFVCWFGKYTNID